MEPHDLVKEGLGDRCRAVGWPRAMKKAYLEKRSTRVKITGLPPTLGKPSARMVSMAALTSAEQMESPMIRLKDH